MQDRTTLVRLRSQGLCKYHLDLVPPFPGDPHCSTVTPTRTPTALSKNHPPSPYPASSRIHAAISTKETGPRWADWHPHQPTNNPNAHANNPQKGCARQQAPTRTPSTGILRQAFTLSRPCTRLCPCRKHEGRTIPSGKLREKWEGMEGKMGTNLSKKKRMND